MNLLCRDFLSQEFSHPKKTRQTGYSFLVYKICSEKKIQLVQKKICNCIQMLHQSFFFYFQNILHVGVRELGILFVICTNLYRPDINAFFFIRFQVCVCTRVVAQLFITYLHLPDVLVREVPQMNFQATIFFVETYRSIQVIYADFILEVF